MGRGTKKTKEKAGAPVASPNAFAALAKNKVPEPPDKGKDEANAEEEDLTSTMPLEKTEPLSFKTEPLSSRNMDEMVHDLFPELCISCTLLERMCRHMMLWCMDSGQVPQPNVLTEFRYMCRDLGNCCGAPRRDDNYGLDSQQDTMSETGKFWKDEKQDEPEQ